VRVEVAHVGQDAIAGANRVPDVRPDFFPSADALDVSARHQRERQSEWER
jgi:hypothetical protein